MGHSNWIATVVTVLFSGFSLWCLLQLVMMATTAAPHIGLTWAHEQHAHQSPIVAYNERPWPIFATA